jgi:hypothetical protein
MDENGRSGGWRQGLWNWLALAALLALGIVWGRAAPPAATRVTAAARAAPVPLAAVRGEGHVRAALR